MVKMSPKFTTTPINSMHRTPHFKGVRMRKWGKWVSEVRMPNSRSRIWLGSYNTARQAAHAYDCAVYFLRGSKANFNFPGSLSKIPSASSLSPAEIQAVAAKLAMEEFLQALEDDAAFSGLESQSCIDSQHIFEEQEWTVLESLLQDAESSQSANLEYFLAPEKAVEDIGFLLLEEVQLRPFSDQAEDLRKFQIQVC